jgi:hypothetical protein
MSSYEKLQNGLQLVREKHYQQQQLNKYNIFIHYYKQDIDNLYHIVLQYYEVDYNDFLKLVYNTSIEV